MPLGRRQGCPFPKEGFGPIGTTGTPADWFLGIQLALRLRHADEIQPLARRIVESPASTEGQRLAAAQVLISLGEADAAESGWKTVESIARGGRSKESLEALLLLARRRALILTQPGASAAAAPDAAARTGPAGAGLPIVDELISLLNRHPLAKAAQKLLIYDLRSLNQPSARADFTNEAVRRFANTGDADDLAALTGWL